MEPDLIDTYVDALHARLRWRPDVLDVVDEVSDHLRAHADRLVAAGTPPHEAQQRTLQCFGDLALVARSFSQTPSGELAVPTRRTRLAGSAGIAAGVVWLLAAVTGAGGGHTDLLTTWTLQRYAVWVAALVVALTLTTVTIAGVLRRVGRMNGPTGVCTVGAGIVLSVSVLVSGWAVTMTMTLLSAAVLLACRSSVGEAGVFLRPLRWFGAAWVVGAAALVLFDEVYPVGPVDGYGDHPVAWLVPFLGCAVTSAGVLAVLGVRLRREHAADVHELPAAPVGPASS